jgi:hypothetical protein
MTISDSILNQLVGHQVRSKDGCYVYTVRKDGIEYQGERLGNSIRDGLEGWVCSPMDVEELKEELDMQEDVKVALWVCGLRDGEDDV